MRQEHIAPAKIEYILSLSCLRGLPTLDVEKKAIFMNFYFYIVRFFTFAKITKWRTLFEKEKNMFSHCFFFQKITSLNQNSNVLDMRYSYSCKEYVVKIP